MIGEALIHHLDVLRVLCGPLRVVDARLAHSLPEIRGETLATILLETESGASVTLHGTLAAPGFPPVGGDRLELIGTRASATFENMELRLLGAQPRRETYDASRGYQASFDGAIAHFVECLRTGDTFETDVADNLETLRLMESAYSAAERLEQWSRHAPRGNGHMRGQS
jgi:predicted dehydrogenase